MGNYKTLVKYVWLLILVSSLTIYLLFPEIFSANYLRETIGGNETFILSVYIIFVMLRPLLFIPSTATLLMGLALYPNSLNFLLITNMLGILFGASILYLAGRYFVPENFFSEKKINKIDAFQEKINQYGFGIVLAWSFFPFVPTDLICFVAGATKMKYLRFIIAVFIGEVALVSIYLWTGKNLFEFLF